MAKVNSQSVNELYHEFKPWNDPYEKARQKGPVAWILRHMSYGSNKYFILFWLIFLTTSGILWAQIKVYMGASVDIFIAEIGSDDFSSITVPRFVGILSLSILVPLTDLLANFQREYIAQKMERDTRHEFYVTLLGKSQSFHDSQRIGDIMARGTNDVRMLNFLISPALTLLFDATLNTFLPIIYIMRLFPTQLLLAPIIFLILFIVTIRDYTKKMGPVTQQNQIEFGNINAILNESLAGIEVVKGMAQEARAIRKYQKIAAKIRELGIKEAKIKALYLPRLLVAIIITLSLGHAILLYINPNGVFIDSEFTIGDIIAYVSLVSTLNFPTNISIWAFAVVKRASAGAKRLIGIMNETSEVKEADSPITQEIRGNIKFNNVSFKYPGSDKYVLNNITFDANPGETIAIVGTTGSGKSTLTKLISRLYNINEGEITIDGININDYSFESLRDQISYIEQDLFLFSYSVKENIAFGKLASDAQIIQAAKDAQADEFIDSLPNQYDTEVGERGVQLSGGERQRIAIARAFISDPKILILDDSTSAIDSDTEDKIQHAISRILANRTTLLITHRLSQIRWADKIILLKRCANAPPGQASVFR